MGTRWCCFRPSRVAEMFRLSSGPLETPRIDNDRAGGFVLFEGRVRSQSGTKDVVRLEYEAHEELAVAEGVKVVQEAVSRFGLSVADVIHRIGPLQVGETAVVIQTSAPHRREAFAACEWIIDQLKIRVPIWKREFFRDGDSGWVGSDAPPAHAGVDTEFFRRQVILPEVGNAG